MKKGKVWLVGAGPGDKELLTLKGRKCLEEADAVVYDLLACPSILNLAKDECELIFAGKKAGTHFKKQSETNRLLAELAMQGKNVVRLKGGDPFVFGRGGEEAEVLKEQGIEFEIVPGVSSCYSAAAYCGIPITHRDYASSFHVITGHKKCGGKEELDFKSLACLKGTQVYLMSLQNLENISHGLISNGKDPKTPAAVISRGTTPHQRIVVSTLEDIAEEAKSQKIEPPALTVIGGVVSLHDELNWIDTKILSGKKIIVTGTKSNSKKLAACLRSYGADAAEISLLGIRETDSDKFSAINWADFTWIVFTSMNGVQKFFEMLVESKIDLRNLMHMKFAAIGKGTAEELADHGIYVDIVPKKFESRYLAEALIPQLDKDDNVLLMRAENGTKILQDMLSENNKKFESFPLYRTQTLDSRKELLQLNLKDADYVVFASSSAVRAYKELTEGADIPNVKLISIGAVTTRTAEELGMSIAATAENAVSEDIVAAIINDVSER